VKDQGIQQRFVLTRAKRRRRPPEPVIPRIGQKTPAEMIGKTRSRANLSESQCDVVRCDLVE
jgi:hypothetical protein